jgi:hypothetical protein
MLDVVQLAKDLTPFLTPLLPYLLKAGEAAAEKAGEKLLDAASDKAKALAVRLWPALAAQPAVLAAAQEVAAAPADEDAQAALRLQLKKLFLEDQALAQSAAQWWAEAQAAGVQVAGNRNVTIGGSVSGSTILTGDNNQVR